MVDPERNRNPSPNWIGKSQQPLPGRRPVLPRYEEPARPTSWLLGMVLLVALCVVLMAVATATLRVLRPNPPSSSASSVTATTERGAARSERNAFEEREQEARVQAGQEADQRREAAAQAHMAEEEAARRASALEARRESGWLAYYRKPGNCDELRPDVDSVGCANDYIRQRRAYDEQFDARRR